MAEARGSDWTDAEVGAIVSSYLGMLRLELAGEPFNKAEENRKLQEIIGRTKGSIEFKHQNISAVIIEAKGIPIDGYKPMRNVQDRLRTAVLDAFQGDAELRQLMLRSVEDTVLPMSGPADLLFQADAPVLELTNTNGRHPRAGRFVDFQQVEAQRRDLGLAGELAVVAHEQRTLRNLGKTKLADRVEHVSITHGDGLGYDVRSFRPSGEEKYIEVKTTRSIKQLPFLVSRNEVEFSTEVPDQFHLYRVFQFGKPQVGFYSLAGSLRSTTKLDPVVYQGRPA
ncbi:protein NO VEIN domain-containing protein [Arthrobacter sp. MDT3-44]